MDTIIKCKLNEIKTNSNSLMFTLETILMTLKHCSLNSHVNLNKLLSLSVAMLLIYK